jgi:flagellar brake protein
MEYEDESAFIIRSPENIISKLGILLKNKCLLTAYFGDNDDSFITTILEIDRKDNIFIFHHGYQENIIEQLLNSPKITFKNKDPGIRVAFDTIRLKKIQHQGISAFAVPIPASILWVERREFYRVTLPFSKSSYCQLTLKDQELINLRLHAISLLGFSMLTDSREVSDLMIPDTHFEQCKLILADRGEDTISFEIRNKYIINPEDLTGMEKIGCKFTRITPAFETTIQRYMQQIEIESRQKN